MFCVSGGGRVVQAALEAKRAGLLRLDGAQALLDRPTSFVDTAARLGLPLRMIDCRQFADKERFRDALSAELEQLVANDLFLTFDWLLPPRIVDLYRGRIINLHMSQLPLFPGRNAMDAALSSGATTAGVTYHLVDEGMDTGPIIAQAITPILPSMSREQLGRSLFKRSVALGIQVLRWQEISAIGVGSGRRALVEGARFDDGPFFPRLDADVSEFALDYLARNYPD